MIASRMAKRTLAVRIEKTLVTVTVDVEPARVKPNQKVSISGLTSLFIVPLPFRPVTIHICDNVMNEINTLNTVTNLLGQYRVSTSFSEPGRYFIYSTTPFASSDIVSVEVYTEQKKEIPVTPPPSQPAPQPQPTPPPSQPKPTVVRSKDLNYGKIEQYSDGSYHIDYSGPGYGCNLDGTANDMLNIADRIDSVADDNINMLTQYQNDIEAGNCVGECVEAKYFEEPTCEQVEEGCNEYQGGFTGHYWTVDELEQEKQPYYNEKDDANAIRNFVQGQTSEEQPPSEEQTQPAPTPPPEGPQAV